MLHTLWLVECRHRTADERGTLYMKSYIWIFNSAESQHSTLTLFKGQSIISILYSTTLLNQLILVLLVNSYDFLYKIMSSANRDNFTLFFLMWMTFISFSCLTAVPRTSSVMLNSRDKSKHCCLVHSLWKKDQSFTDNHRVNC